MYVICDEALIDIFLLEGNPDQLNKIRFDAHIGGSSFNLSVGLARLEIPTALFTVISNDLLGRRLVANLEHEKVSCEYLVRKDNPTTLSLVGADATGSPQYAFYGHNAADRNVESRDIPELKEDVTGLHFGSYSIVAEPTAQNLLTTVRRDKGQLFISFDPNVRLNVEPDFGVWRNCVAQFMRCADLVKISEEDFEALYPGQNPDVVFGSWLAEHPNCVIYTRGGKGATAYHSAGQVSVAPPKIEVVDTVGAGDSFMAAFLSELIGHQALSRQSLDGLSLIEIENFLSTATRAAALTCQRRGADLPGSADLGV